MSHNNLGEKMRQVRASRGLTQNDVAEAMGVSAQYVSRWESGERNINANQLMEFAKIVGVTLDYFSDDSHERTLFQLLAQLENVFNAADIGEADKDKAYQDIMKIYLKSKESAPSDKKEGSRKEDIIGD
ncbi:MAG: helix-turn-helix domain-containing protein [Lentihominibacter sp.]